MALWHTLDRIRLYILGSVGIYCVPWSENVLVQGFFNHLWPLIHRNLYSLLQALWNILSASNLFLGDNVDIRLLVLSFILEEQAKILRNGWKLVQLNLLVYFVDNSSILYFNAR